MMEQSLLNAARLGWGWTGLEPKRLAAVNAFGNLLLEDETGQYWRICPEELCAEIVADDERAYNGLVTDSQFLKDWEMTRIVELAAKALGAPAQGRCYCLKKPGLLGGDYGSDNLDMISIEELILSSGEIAMQIKDIPDGGKIQIQITD